MRNWLLLLIVLTGWSWGAPLQAQIRPDRTLGGESTSVVTDSGTISIQGGALRSDTLFHSFEAFNVRQGEQVYFSSDAVERIISRVTGDGPSLINGVLGATGTADLYFINPNGILFGPEATLDIGGSFIGTTASEATFDNLAYSAETPEAVPPLLTIRGNIGFLQQNHQAPIEVSGLGHDIRVIGDEAINPFENAGQSSSGLRVDNGESIILQGSQILLEGGVVTAPSGNILIEAIQQGTFTVDLDEGLAVLPGDFQSGEVIISDRSVVDVSGLGRGNVSIRGNNVRIDGGSYILDQNSGVDPSGNIFIQADNQVELVGSNTIVRASNVIGEGGDIEIISSNLAVLDGAGILSTTYGVGSGADIRLRVTDGLAVIGGSVSTGVPSHIQAVSLGSASSGDLSIEAETVNIENGGNVGTIAYSFLGSPRSGDLTIKAQDILVSDRNPDLLALSLVYTGSGYNSASGDFQISADSLEISGGAFFGSFAFGKEPPGDVDITSSAIKISGFSDISSRTFETLEDEDFDASSNADLILPPALIDFSNFVSPVHLDRTIIAAIYLPDLSAIQVSDVNPQADSGNVRINTGLLHIEDYAFVNTVNSIRESAGNIDIDADILVLDRGGISADLIQFPDVRVQHSDNTGGNIRINSGTFYASDLSLVSASASGFSSGGNLRIDSENLVLIDSILRANGQIGSGGFVDISSGLFYGDRSQILATSELSASLDGTVEFEVDETLENLSTFELYPTVNNNLDNVDNCSANGILELAMRQTLADTNVILPELWSPSDLTASIALSDIETSSKEEVSHWIMVDDKVHFLGDSIYNVQRCVRG